MKTTVYGKTFRAEIELPPEEAVAVACAFNQGGQPKDYENHIVADNEMVSCGEFWARV